MNELLDILSSKRTLLARIVFFGILAVGTGAYLLTRVLIRETLAPEPWILQTGIWVLWLSWQGHFFQQHRLRYLERYEPGRAYRTAFFRDILPGASCAFALMSWPVVSALLEWRTALDPDWFGALWALPVLAVGVGLLATAVRTIGVEGALFLREYVTVEEPLTDSSIYSCIRHPLFLGAVAVSLGAAGLTGSTDALTLGLVNLAIMPIYRRLEDRRQEQVYGETYRAYRASVNAFLPAAPVRSLWLRRLQASLFFVR